MAGDIISSLGIQITSNASGATKSLNTLNKGLERLIGNLSQVQGKGAGLTIGNLGTQTQKTARATNLATNSFKTFEKTTKTTTLGVKSLASAFGKLYANYFLVMRAFKALGRAISSSMDYVETYNYFNVTMEKISKEWSKDYKKWGYDNADAYADSFESRIEALNKKMTGYTLGEEGETIFSGEKNLGLDINTMMNYQARIGAVTNSLGLMGETSVNIQKAMSMLSADMSSFANVDLTSVMTNFQSGLIGQSRALYKYGIDITNATLETYAYANGVGKAVAEMSQGEKLQLRLLAVLDQSKVAWGDQANTINTAANQYRIFKQQFANLGRTIGNLFLPVVTKILPIINGLVIAMNELLASFGISLWGDDWLKNIMQGTSTGYFDDTELGGLEEDAEGASNALEDASKNAKKLKDNLIGIDKLNIISPDDGSGNGKDDKNGAQIDLSNQIASAVADYEKVWEEAFKRSENLAQKYANRIVNAFRTGNWKSVGNYWSNKLNESLKNINWGKAYENAKGFGSGLANFLNGLITPTTFNTVGETIAKYLNTVIYTKLSFAKTFDWTNLGESIASGINGFFENYDFSALAENINTWVQGIFKTITTAFINIKWGSVFKGLFSFLGELDPQTVVLLLVATRFRLLYRVITRVGLAKAFSVLAGSLNGLILEFSAFTGLSQKIQWGVARIGDKFTRLRATLGPVQKGLIGLIAVWTEFRIVSDTIEGVYKGTESLALGILKIASVATIASAALYLAFGPAGIAVGAVTGLIASVVGAQEALKEIGKQKDIENFVDRNAPKLEEHANNFEAMADSITENAENMNSKLSEIENVDKGIDETVLSIQEIENSIRSGATTIETETENIKSSMDDLVGSLTSKADLTNSLVVGVLYSHEKELEQMGYNVDKLAKDVTSQTNKYKEEATKAVKNLESALLNYGIDSQQYKKAKQRYLDAVGDTGEIGQAVENANKNIKKLQNKIDFTEFFDGTTFNAEKFKNDMKAVADVYTQSKDEIISAYDKTIEEIENSDQWDNATKQMLINAQEALKQAELGNLDTAFKNNITVPLQKTIADAVTNAVGTDDALIQNEKALEDFKQNIYGPIQSELETLYNDLGLDVDTLNKDLIDDIIDGLYVKDDETGGWKLRDDVEEFIQEQIEGTRTKYFGVQTLSGKLNEMFDLALSETKTLWDLNIEFNKISQNKVDRAISDAFKGTTGGSILNLGSIGLKKAPLYATGGFPEDGLFFANHSELVGKFANGKTAVANNQQITAGIEEASYRGFLRALSQSNTNNGTQTIVVQSVLDGKVVAESTNRYNARSGSRSIGYNTGY